jgi:hypothetical protein
LGQGAFAQSLAPATSLVSYLESSEGFVKFESLVSSPEKLAQMQNFLRGRGLRDQEITNAVRARDAVKLRTMMEEALTRGLTDPALANRIGKAAQEMLGVSDADLNRVASLKLSRPGDGASAPGRAALIRGGSSGAIDFGTMPGGKYGPPMPVGPVANPVRPFAVESFVAQLEEIEAKNGGLSAAAKRALLNDPDLVGESVFDDCFGGKGGTLLEEGPRHLLEKFWERADEVALNDAYRDAKVTRLALDEEKRVTFRDEDEARDAMETLTKQCQWPGPRYARGLSAIRAGLVF